MLFLPKRPGPYILGLLLMVLMLLVAWMFHALSSPEIQQAVREKAARKKKEAPVAPTPPPLPPARPPQTSAPAPVATPPAPPPAFIDPLLEERSLRLNAADGSPKEDLEVLAGFLDLYRRARGGNPAGQNEDITAALTGTGGMEGRVFPPGHSAVRDGQLVDRWGTPFWFHPNSGHQMEIRSAGPDKTLFTGDDVVHGASPGGFGATPAEAAP